MKEEAYKIRHEIQRLNQRLKEIENESLNEEEKAELSACNVCGQDLVLNHIQKLCRERGSRNMAIMSATENTGSKKWYSTTITPDALPYLLRSVDTIIDYLLPKLDIYTLKILQYLSIECKELSCSASDVSKKLNLSTIKTKEKLDDLLVSKVISLSANEEYMVTIMGWHTYITLAHLSYNYTYKLDIEKAVLIAPVFKEVFDKDWGEYLDMSFEYIHECLSKNGHIEKLHLLGVTDADIEKAVYECNYK